MRKFILTICVSALFIFYLFAQRKSAPVLPVPLSSLPNSPADNISNFIPSSSTSSLASVTPAIPINKAPISSSQPPPTPKPKPQPAPPVNQRKYKNGNYIGSTADAFYGLVQVEAIIKNGQIADVQFLQYPNDRQHSVLINSQAMPYLKQEAISAQSANVDIVSGATATSQAFIQSLASALSQAS